MQSDQPPRDGQTADPAGGDQPDAMSALSVSAPFIHRPIATSLLGIAVLMGGLLGYSQLPVSSLPLVDFPTVQVSTQLPGANPDTISALVTAPLERQFGQIPSLSMMMSQSSFGISQITLQFDLNRDIDGAAQDVQAAINAARSTLASESAVSADLFEGQPRRCPDRHHRADVAHDLAAPTIRRCRRHAAWRSGSPR